MTLRRFGGAILALLHLVCPLLFFTNLTRNPYYTQIALLNIGIALVGVLWAVDTWRRGEWRVPRFPFDAPLVAFLLIAALSTVLSWTIHAGLRPGILCESVRVWVFTLVNSVMALYLPVFFTQPLPEEPPAISIWSDIHLASVWGLAWVGFQTMKSPDPRDILWDTYGFFLWVLAAVYALRRTRHGGAVEFFHVIYAVSLLAGIYGILQYSGRDVIWSTLIQPYGGRPVSTFGNPNFLSSYLMLVAPVALAFSFQARGKDVWGYVLVSFVCVVSLLCTLTRSTYLGLLASFLSMGFFLYRPENRVWIKRVGVGAAVFIALIIIFPKTPVSTVQSPLARFTEIFEAIQSGAPYGPWHQRILIWSSAWDRVREQPLFGKGWGTFELFYPFYQGHYLMHTLLGQFRTHANNAHNVLLEIWSQIGILGVGAAAWLITAMFAGGYLIVKRRTRGLSQSVSAALLAGVVGMAVDNFFGNVSIFFAVPAFLFWWNVGALYNEGKGSGLTFNLDEATRLKLRPDPLRRPLKLAGRGLLALLLVFGAGVSVYFVKRWNQEVYYFQGFRESKMGDVVASYKSLEKAFRWFAGEVNSNYELGNSYSQHAKALAERGRADEARRFWEKAEGAYAASLRANPGYDEIYFNLGITQFQLGKNEEGVRNLETALFINPLLRETYGSLGNYYASHDQPASAARVFGQAVAVFPQDKDFWNNLGVTYSKLRDHQKSLEAYKKALEIDPNFSQAWHNLSAAASETGRRDPLLEVPSLIGRMQTLVTQNNFTEARKVAARLVELMPGNADAHLSLANVLFYLNQKEASLREYERALEIRPAFGTAHLNMGKVYQSQGNLEAARAHYRKALEIDPNDKEARLSLNGLPSN